MLSEEVREAVRNIAPTGDRILVRLERDARKVGMIILPDGGKSLDVVVSQVVAKGPLVKSKPWELAVGDYVIHVRVAGVAYDGTLGLLGKMSQVKDADYKFVKESELLAVVSPDVVGKVEGTSFHSEGRTGQCDLRSL